MDLPEVRSMTEKPHTSLKDKDVFLYSQEFVFGRKIIKKG